MPCAVQSLGAGMNGSGLLFRPLMFPNVKFPDGSRA